jgi:ribosome-associated protein
MHIARMQQLVQDALIDAKAQDISILDVHEVAGFTDVMIVASGTSTRHVQSVADKVIYQLREQGVRALGVEGEKIGEWVLIDFGEVVVHVMRPQTRDFYNLEKLWSVGGHAESE